MAKVKMFLVMILSSMTRRKARLFITLLAVAIGATIISGMITVYREVPAQMSRAFRAYGANLLILPGGEKDSLPEDEMGKVKKALAGYEIVGATPFLYDTLGVNKQSVIVGGTDFAELQKVSPYWQIEGAYPAAGQKEILLGAEFAQQLGVKVGQSVTVSAGEGKRVSNLTISGIVRTGGKEEQLAYVDLKRLQQITEHPGVISLAQLSIVADGEKLDAVTGLIEKAVP